MSFAVAGQIALYGALVVVVVAGLRLIWRLSGSLLDVVGNLLMAALCLLIAGVLSHIFGLVHLPVVETFLSTLAAESGIDPINPTPVFRTPQTL